MKYPKSAHLFMLFFTIFTIFLCNSISNGVIAFIFKIFPNITNQNKLLIEDIVWFVICFSIPIGLYILYLFIKKEPIKELIPVKRLSIKNIFILIFLTFCIMPTEDLIGSITNIFFENQIEGMINLYSSVSLIGALFSGALLPAIFEEIAFRGIVLTGLKKVSILSSILISALYFGLMHLTVTQVFYATFFGIVMAIVVKVTKSIYASMLMHFVFNGVSGIVSHLFNDDLSQVVEQTSNTTSIFSDLLNSFIFFIISLPFLVFCTYLFIKHNKEEIKQLKEENKVIKNDKNRPKAVNWIFYVNVIICTLFIVIVVKFS